LGSCGGSCDFVLGEFEVRGLGYFENKDGKVCALKIIETIF